MAQLHDDITIYNNTSTNLSIEVTGGTPPYNITFNRNGIPQPPVTGYRNGEYTNGDSYIWRLYIFIDNLYLSTG
jgi:hypothetical protein